MSYIAMCNIIYKIYRRGVLHNLGTQQNYAQNFIYKTVCCPPLASDLGWSSKPDMEFIMLGIQTVAQRPSGDPLEARIKGTTDCVST